MLLRTIRDLHAQRYGYESGVTDEMLERYLKAVLASVISTSMITPREITRDLIGLLDTMHQNPQTRFDDMISGRRVEPDSDPDDDIIEDLEI